MGTTLTAVALVVSDGRDALAVANVGDSRTYVFPDGILQVTATTRRRGPRGHGEITGRGAVHPQRHILTRALGICTDVETDLWEVPARSGRPAPPLQRRAVQRGDRRADRRRPPTSRDPDRGGAPARSPWPTSGGGPDNITVVVVDVVVGEEASDVLVITPIGARDLPVCHCLSLRSRPRAVLRRRHRRRWQPEPAVQLPS